MKYLKKFEGILQPYRLEEREELLKGEIIRKLSSEIIEGDLVIDHPLYLEIESRVKKVVGDVKIKLYKIPLWMADVEVGGSFDCSGNNLTTLSGSPKSVGGDFRCPWNNLTNLEGAPGVVGGDFNCSGNELTSLECAPRSVGRDFDCSGNNLTKLEGSPRVVGRDFDCSWNNLTSLKGAPGVVGGIFYCHNNPIKFTESDVQSVSNVRVGIIL